MADSNGFKPKVQSRRAFFSNPKRKVTPVTDQQSQFSAWMDRESVAESMIPMIGRLYREHNVTTSVYGRPIINRSVIDIIKTHRFVRRLDKIELSVHDTYPILEALTKLPLGPSKIDIGRLATKYIQQGEGKPVQDFVAAEIAEALKPTNSLTVEPTDVVLYGFGRIGRLLARIMIEKYSTGNGLRLRAIVVRKQSEDDLEKRASLLRRDSVHGSFKGTIVVDNEKNTILANGTLIQVIYSDSPASVDYTKYGISNAIVVDNTGKWRDEKGLSQHLGCAGVAKVLLTAPGKGDMKNIVFGVNHDVLNSDDRIISAASCTTNAIVPVLKVINDKYEIEAGHVETVHSYTNDQNLIDNFHKGSRRGRSAPLNMVITETGAAKAAAKALPVLAGKLTGNAIRVPTPNVSLAILNLTLKSGTSRDELNDYLREQALNSSLRKQIDYVASSEVVSTDFVGSRHAGIVDSESTIVNGNRCVLYVWYDNEFGYSCQVVRILQHISGPSYPTLPK